MTACRLLVDLGGTHTRCALQESGQAPTHRRSTRNADFPALADVLHSYLDELEGKPKPEAAAMAVAGPVSGDRIDLTNLGWSFSCAELREQLGLDALQVVNDFTAVAMSLPFLPDSELVQVGGGERQPGGAMAVLGPGTGLGVSGLLPAPGGWAALSGEGGHVTLAASDEREAKLISLVRERHGHVSAERLVSGLGLSNLYEALGILAGEPGERVRPEDVSMRADAGDHLARDALDQFFALLGVIAGNLALTIGARGGVYVAGGIAPQMRRAMLGSRFRQKFEDKGRYQAYLAHIPTFLIMEQVPAFRGLAAILDGHMVSPAREGVSD